ncbi:MAG: ankyrin repeat domain-containing protein [Vulcanimicrobiota bacterium]
MWNAINSDDLVSFRAILEKHSDLVNHNFGNGETPLHIAAMMGKTKAAELLIQHNANVNEKASQNATPLHMATSVRVKDKTIDIVKLLIKNGADLNTKTSLGDTPLHSYYKIFRNTAGTPLPSDQVFDLLVHECAQVSRDSGTTLVNIETPVYHRTIFACIKKLDNIKPVKSGFSHMAVAKFTHFFNPRLFPIYDNDVVWRKLLCGVFSEDYRQFCRIHNMRASENGPEFNVNYIRLAGECLRENSNEVMDVFGKWFRKETENYSDPTDVRNDMETYFATAFEFVAIGAAALKGENF